MKKLKRESAITTMDDVVDGKTQFSDLPSCLVIYILLRLPISTLLTCMCVCKDWIRLLRDADFIKLQLAASPVHILNRHITEDGMFRFGRFMEDTCTATGDVEVKILNLPTKLDFLTLLNLPPTTGIYDYGCISSCNGLLCLMDRSDYFLRRPFAGSIRVCVCNPILGEWVSISTPVRKYDTLKSNRILTAMALVFSAKNNQYKLLHSFLKTEEGKEDDYGLEIYTLGGTRQWRSIDETLGCRPWMSSNPVERVTTTFLHGSLHWVGSSTTRLEWSICCFDVDYEKFGRRLSLPSLPSHEEKLFRNSHWQLGAMDDCLCLGVFYGYKDHLHYEEIEIWVMKEYGVEKSWGKMLTIKVCLERSNAYILFSQNEDEILIYDKMEGLVCYDLKRNMRKYSLGECREKSYYFHFRVAYKPSFVSLQDAAKGEEVILSRTMRAVQ